MTSAKEAALEDVFRTLRLASEEGGCWKLIERGLTCHEAGVPQGRKCALCELWGAWETYEELVHSSSDSRQSTKG